MAENKGQRMKEYDIDFLEKLNQCEFRITVASRGNRFIATYSKDRGVFVNDFCGCWYPPSHISRKNTGCIYVLDLCGEDSVQLIF